MTTRITGEELLQRVDEMTGQSKAVICRATGYTLTTKDGKTRLDYSGLSSAILAAHGHEFAEGTLRPRAAAYQLRVNKNCQLHIGKAYLSKLGADTGTVFTVALEDDRIILARVKAAPELGATPDGSQVDLETEAETDLVPQLITA